MNENMCTYFRSGPIDIAGDGSVEAMWELDGPACGVREDGGNDGVLEVLFRHRHLDAAK